MENQDSTMRFPFFYGMGKDDVVQHWFTCEEIWLVKRVRDYTAKIMQIETTFRDRALMWYMKYKDTAPAGHARSMFKIK
jgi:hypothetical protein